MAQTDKTNTNANQTTSSEPETLKEGNATEVKEEKNNLNVNDLLAEIAQLKAEKAKSKNAITKLTSENGNLNKALREKMTAAEQQAEEEEKARLEHEAYVKELEKKVALNEATKRYMEMGMDAEMAGETAVFELDGNMEAVGVNWKKHTENAIKAKEAEWIKSRPSVNIGNQECPVTQKAFNKMGYTERAKFKKEYPEAYEKYVGR